IRPSATFSHKGRRPWGRELSGGPSLARRGALVPTSNVASWPSPLMGEGARRADEGGAAGAKRRALHTPAPSHPALLATRYSLLATRYSRSMRRDRLVQLDRGRRRGLAEGDEAHGFEADLERDRFAVGAGRGDTGDLPAQLQHAVLARFGDVGRDHQA